MSDNKLLAENTIRRFMKLANVEGLTENFIDDLEERGGIAKRGEEKKPGKRDGAMVRGQMEEDINEEEANEEVDLEEEFNPLEEEEEEEEMELDTELGAEDDMDAELDAEMDAEPEAGAADMSLSEEEAQLLIDLGERLSAAMGGAEEAPADDMGDLDAEAPEAPEAPEEDEEMMEEEFDQEDLVNEVLKRVTKRLVAEKLKNRK